MLQYEIKKDEFRKIASFIYDQLGIHLADHKINLVRSRLSKRLRFLGLTSFSQYYDYLLDDDNGQELLMLTNVISTNVTSFFREPSQWEYLQSELKEYEKSGGEKKLRIWSAACSSGEEPYTIGIFLHSTLSNIKDWDIKILATDISEEILTKAANGVYASEDIKGLPKHILLKHFTKIKIVTKTGKYFTYKIKKNIKDMVMFRKFNLVNSEYKIIKPETFDLIFCRNVMIYFDKGTKAKVVENLLDKLKKNGNFFIGHSESLVSMDNTHVKLQAPSIYKKLKG